MKEILEFNFLEENNIEKVHNELLLLMDEV